jgi:hypothetical protein
MRFRAVENGVVWTVRRRAIMVENVSKAGGKVKIRKGGGITWPNMKQDR